MAEEKENHSSVEGVKSKIAEDTTKPQPSVADRTGDESLDKVRDILFGAHMQGYDKRLILLEERLLRESANLRTDIKKCFDSLESHIKKEVESLTDKLEGEHDERAQVVEGISQELNNLAELFERKTLQINEQATEVQREIHRQIIEQSSTLRNEIRQKHDEALTMVERGIKELRNNKTDRYALADLLKEVAARLQTPGSEDGNG